uniref:glycosyltransferase n=1 Tax=Dysosmobacter sp. TaxID=2591382 RepID=UPI003A9220B1
MKKRIAILANHSGGLYDFRKDLIAELKKHANVTVAVPHNDRWEELHKLVDEVIELPVDRRGMNPIHDSKLFRQYRAMLKEVKPDLVLTYTIKPNIYGGLACRMAHIPYAVNITGLGSAIENGGWLKKFVLALYKPALKGARVVFFENAGNRDTLAATGVVPKGRDVVLSGAGVNLEDYPYQPYPQEGPVRFLFVGRV